MSEKNDIVENLMNSFQNLEKEFSKLKGEFESFKNKKDFNEITEKIIEEENEEDQALNNIVEHSEDVDENSSENAINGSINSELYNSEEVSIEEQDISKDSEEINENHLEGGDDIEILSDYNQQNGGDNSLQTLEITNNIEEEENLYVNSQSNVIEGEENLSENSQSEQEIKEGNESKEILQSDNKTIKNTKKRRNKYYSKNNLQSRKKIRELYTNLREGLERNY